MKYLISIIALALFAGFDSGQSTNVSLHRADEGSVIKKIVLDAGHGGHDPGCKGSQSHEKNVALNVVLKLGKYIEEKIPDIEVIYTRKTDKFVELSERAAIANRNNADLFISIHCNAASPAAYGTETYVMGPHKNESNLVVTKRENAVILLEENYQSKYDYDPNSPVAHILFSIYQNAFLSQSMSLAEKVEGQFKNRVNRSSRGVKQAGFVVLYRTSMPSILIETGFLTNPGEEKFLNSEQGQDLIASGIFRALRDYKDEMEGQDARLKRKVLNEEPKQPKTLQPGGSQPKSDSVQEIHKEETPPSESGIEFKIQFMANSPEIDVSKYPYNKLSDISSETYTATLSRYYSGHFANPDDAMKHLSEVKQNGFPDAFIVSFINGERKSFKEGAQLFDR